MIAEKISAMAFVLLIAGVSHANHPRLFEVTITNVTRAQAFTPQLVVTHTSEVAIFELGKPASLAPDVPCLQRDGQRRQSTRVCVAV